MDKPKVAFYWCASCGGCEEAIVDLNEAILDVVAAVDIMLWPVALDFKHDDIHNFKDGEIAASFINGAVRTSEQEEISRLLRQKSKYIISFGACSHLGGVVGLANFYDRDSIFNRVYLETESTDNLEKRLPKIKSNFEGKELELPEFYKRVYSLDQIIDVNYYIPGCPPTPDVINDALTALLKAQLPKEGSILTKNIPLCKDCTRKDSKPDKVLVKEFKRVYEVIDNGKCFLDQAVICLGPATRTGCSSSCINANMPCRGCFGPTADAFDPAAEVISAVGSLAGAADENDVPAHAMKKVVRSIEDPAGTFYRFTLASSLFHRAVVDAPQKD